MSKLKVQRSLYFSSAQVKIGEKIAKSLGLTFNAWVKYLVVKELDTIVRQNKSEEEDLRNKSSNESNGLSSKAAALNKYLDELKGDDLTLPY